jgi:hypothetical protein
MCGNSRREDKEDMGNCNLSRIFPSLRSFMALGGYYAGAFSMKSLFDRIVRQHGRGCLVTTYLVTSRTWVQGMRSSHVLLLALDLLDPTAYTRWVWLRYGISRQAPCCLSAAAFNLVWAFG